MVTFDEWVRYLGLAIRPRTQRSETRDANGGHRSSMDGATPSAAMVRQRQEPNEAPDNAGQIAGSDEGSEEQQPRMKKPLTEWLIC